MGVFQQVVAGMEPKESLRDILGMLRNTSNPQVEYFVRIIKKWCKENGACALGSLCVGLGLLCVVCLCVVVLVYFYLYLTPDSDSLAFFRFFLRQASR